MLSNETPKDYVQNQEEYNSIHLDGQMESADEEACGYARGLCSFLIKNKLVPGSVLDIGCRTGYTLDTFQEWLPNARIVGVDIVPNFVRVATKRGEAYQADMHKLPFADGEFDWVFSTGTIEHAYDAAKACSEMFRVARMGVLCAADVAPKYVFDKNPSHYTYKMGPSDWIKEMYAALPPNVPWQLISVKMPCYTVADMMWASPELYAKLQEPIV